MRPPDVDALGQDLTPRYALGALLGKGGFGAVHRARDLAAGRDVAIKLLGATSGAAMDRFLREATVAATLEHPGIVRVHAAGRHSGRPAIVYELVEGETFSAATRALPASARAALVRDAARAVGHAHARGVVHRDLKPDNLLVGDDGRVRVADFGLAWHEGADHLTRTGAVLGTPAYMAPELFEERRPEASTAADVWALGVVLYEALTGRLPFDAPDLVTLAGQLERARPTPPRRVDPSIDPALEAVCLGALRRDPAARYPDGEALAQALDDALAGRLRPTTTRRALLGGGAAALLALGVAGAWGLRAERPAAPLASREATPPTASTEPTPAAATPTPAVSDAPLADRQLLAASAPRWAVWVDARRVLTGGDDDDLRLWDAATGEPLRTWPRRARAAARIAPGRVALGSATGLHLLDVDGEERPSALGRFEDVRQIVCAEATGRLGLIARTSDAPWPGAHVVDPDGVRRRAPIEEGRAPVCLALSADGEQLAVSLGDERDASSIEGGEGTTLFNAAGTVQLFEARGAIARRSRALIPGLATAVCFTRDGEEVLAGSNLGQAGFIPVSAGEVMGEFVSASARPQAHRGGVCAVRLSPDGARVYTLAAVPDLPEPGWEVRAWDRRSRAELGTSPGGPGHPLTLDASPGGRALVIGTRGGGVHVRVVDGTD